MQSLLLSILAVSVSVSGFPVRCCCADFWSSKQGEHSQTNRTVESKSCCHKAQPTPEQKPKQSPRPKPCQCRVDFVPTDPSSLEAESGMTFRDRLEPTHLQSFVSTSLALDDPIRKPSFDDLTHQVSDAARTVTLQRFLL